MRPLLTIITPTYNRGDLLKNCYESLKNQSNKNFEWIIIDDGSTDNTECIVKNLIEEDIIKIKYFKKVNGGKHTALNVGFEEAMGELTIIVDSDDLLINEAVSIISKLWHENKNINNLSSIVFLRSHSDGKIIGDEFPKDRLLSNHIQCRINMGINGDKSEVYVTKVLKKYKFPVFEGEKFMSEGIVWYRIGKEYDALYVNKAIYITEYLPGGLTKSGRNLRIKCPLGGIEASKEGMSKEVNLKQRVKHTLLYVSYSYFANKDLKDIINNNNNKYLTIASIPLGYCLYRYWNNKYITNENL